MILCLRRAPRERDSKHEQVLQDVDPVGDCECRREGNQNSEFYAGNAEEQKVSDAALGKRGVTTETQRHREHPTLHVF
jgi:hypothetical protein